MSLIQDNDMLSIILNKLEKMNDKLFEKINNKLDSRFDNNDIKLDRQSREINELKYEIQEINKSCKSTHETIMTSLNKLEQSVEPVSYTHLDVYKRQVTIVTNHRI